MLEFDYLKRSSGSRLGWHDLEGLVAKFQNRVGFGVRAEIIKLTIIPFVKNCSKFKFLKCSSCYVTFGHGVLSRETLKDVDLDKYRVVVMDEARERLLNTNVLFGILKKFVARRRDFKIVFRL
ncbi:pre-mRNA-splicing factor ATP-dependent RNA helicase PRP16-like [Apium graveolens]|uniref:pre-mRNA-splicing factor ATP-dependent RNA helicase PRP16-like n=1 Tax=Apium graveolens TaxID=4045 RepID=UPI003D7A5BB7